jgi:hypothetical protein
MLRPRAERRCMPRLACSPCCMSNESVRGGRLAFSDRMRSATACLPSSRCRSPGLLFLSVTLLSVSNVGISFGADELFKNVTFTVAEGERWGIIGRNGAGKTSIFNVITGDLQPTVGSVARKPGLRHALLDQHRAFEGATTVWQADSTRRRGGMNGRTSRMNAPSAMSSMSVRAPSPAWRSSTT